MRWPLQLWLRTWSSHLSFPSIFAVHSEKNPRSSKLLGNRHLSSAFCNHKLDLLITQILFWRIIKAVWKSTFCGWCIHWKIDESFRWYINVKPYTTKSRTDYTRPVLQVAGPLNQKREHFGLPPWGNGPV